MNIKASIITIVKVIIFLVILAYLLTFLGKVFLPHEHKVDQQQHQYYYFPKNTIDVLCDGNSKFRQGVSPNMLWHDFGIVAYSRVDGHQCPEMNYFEIRDTLRHHDVKLVILGVFPGLLRKYDYVKDEPLLRRNMDYKHLSLLKIKTAAYISSHTDILETVSYIFPIFRYHSRWKDLTYEESALSFTTDRDIWRGQLYVKNHTPFKAKRLSETSKEEPEFDKEALKWYRKTIRLCKNRDIDVLIVAMPDIDDYTLGIHNSIQDFADSNGLDFLDFNTDAIFDEIGLNYEEHFENRRHVTSEAAEKITEYLGRYIVDNYDVPQWECTEETSKMLDEDYNACVEEAKRKTDKDQGQDNN